MNLDRAHTSRRRVATAVSAILATSAALLGAGTPPAQAKINSGIVFTDAIFKHVDPSGVPITGRQEVWQGDNVEFSVNYDGTNAHVAFGDEFTVDEYVFHVQSMRRRRVSLLRVSAPEPTDTAEEQVVGGEQDEEGENR